MHILKVSVHRGWIEIITYLAYFEFRIYPAVDGSPMNLNIKIFIVEIQIIDADVQNSCIYLMPFAVSGNLFLPCPQCYSFLIVKLSAVASQSPSSHC